MKIRCAKIITMQNTLTTHEAAARLGISRERVAALLKGRRPKLTGEKRGRDWFVDAASVEARLASEPQKGRPAKIDK